jgi:hypothetical protein
MEADDDALYAIRAHDRKWLVRHRAELWPAAQEGYAKYGRGALLVMFGEDEQGPVVVAYTARPTWQASRLMKQLARYNPATQLVVVCVGQLVDTEVVPGPRVYVVQCLTLAA